MPMQHCTDNESLPLSVRIRLEPICERFEQAWQDGERPDVAVFLEGACDAERSALAWELLRLDAEYRRMKGETPVAEDYRHLDLDSHWLAGALCPGESIPIPPEDTPSPSGEPSLIDGEATSGQPFGDYVLQEEIGRGGMGIVNKARQQQPVRIVALKRIRAGGKASLDEIKRFQTEAQNVADLNHPHIVRIYEVRDHQGQYYFTMPFYERGSLNQHLPRFQKDYRSVARLLATVARAVHYAHQRRLLHRDLKPANILLDEKDRPVVADFGLATRITPEGAPGFDGGARVQGQDTVNAEPSKTGPICGTPPYMSPEQAEGKRVLSTAVDVYGLGAILYELLTGKPPFKAATVNETLRLVKEEPIAPPQSLNRRMPIELESICRKCLHKSPEDRYASAEAVADDLERWLRGETPVVHPIGRVRRLVKWAKRRPMLAFLWSAVIVLLLFGAGIVAWHIGAMNEAADRIGRQFSLTSIRLAAGYVERNQLDRAEETLDKCSPALRHWEWYYLKRLCHREEIRLRGHTGSVLSLEYSPDGARIATAGMDGTVRIWNPVTREELYTLRGHKSFVNNVCFSKGGRLLISASADGTVKFWDPATGREREGLPIKSHQIAASRRNNVLAALSRENSISVWDVVARKNLWTLTNLKEQITNIALSPDGRFLAAVGYHESLKVWDIHDRRELPPFFGSDERSSQRIMFGIAFSPDGNYLVVGAENPLIWNFHTRKATRLYGTGGLRCSRMVFSPNSKWIAATGRDGLVRVWDIDSETIVLSLDKEASQDLGLDFSPDGSHLALSRGREVGILKNINKAVVKTHRVLKGHTFLQVGTLVFSPDSRWLASRAGDREIILWDARNGKAVRMLVSPTRISNEANLAFSPDGRWLVSGCQGDQLLVWEVETGPQKRLRDPSAKHPLLRLRPEGGIAGHDERPQRTFPLGRAEERTHSEFRPRPQRDCLPNLSAGASPTRHLRHGRFGQALGHDHWQGSADIQERYHPCGCLGCFQLRWPAHGHRRARSHGTRLGCRERTRSPAHSEGA